MSPWISGILAFGVCACSLPLAIRAAAYWHIYDQPGDLKIHTAPIPRVGGIAMMIGFFAATESLCFRTSAHTVFALLAILGVWSIGLVDDIRGLPPFFRLLVQLGAGSVLWAEGWRLGWFASGPLDLLFTALFVAFFINAMNMFDGMDGLAASWTAFTALGFLLVSDGPFSKTLAACLIGICAGVLLSNFPPAKLFMGDSGSTLLGISLALLCLDWMRTQPQTQTYKFITPLLFAALPLTDAALAVFRRLISFQSPLLGDRRHFYDLLLQRGWSVQKTLLATLTVTAVTILTGVLTVYQSNAATWAIAVDGIFLFSSALLLGSFSARSEVKTAQLRIGSMNSIEMTMGSTTQS